MESLVIVFFSTLLFYSSDAGTFTWLHSDATVNFMEGETAKLNWSVQIGAGKTWVAVKITRSITNLGAASVDLIRRKPSGVDILLTERGADMDLDVQANLNVLNVSFSLGNLLRKTDEMYYRITVVDDDLDSSVRYTKLNVDVPSSCKIHPNGTTVNETENVLLNVTTTGNPPVNEYIWTHPNGSRLDANSTLSFNASRQDNGTFKVSVYNGVGDWSYCTSNVSVQFPSSCKIHPNATTVNETEHILLNVITTGNPPVNIYIWTHRNGRRLQCRDMLIFSASIQDAGTYKVSVYNGIGDWSYCTSNVTVQYKPYDTMISHSPNKTRFCLGNVISITCTSNANPVVEKYSLYRNEELDQENNNGLFEVQLNKTGINRFTCEPKNKIGVGEKQNLSLINVTEPPEIINCQILENGKKMYYVVEGSKVELRCNVSGSEPLNKTWTHGQQVWNESTVVFPQVNRSDTGTYKLTVSNGKECNKTETSLKLDVYYVPEFIAMEIFPNKTKLCRGDQIHVNCSAIAKPEAYYLLYQNDQLFSIFWSGYFIAGLYKSGNVTITFVPRNEAGDGKNISKRLEVKEPPEIINCQILENGKEMYYVVEGSKLELRCNVSGSEPLNKTWTNGRQVWYNSTLVFPQVNRSDTGTYKLTVNNGEECNKTETSLKLDVYYVPESTTMEIFPNNTKLCRGDQIHVNCSAIAKPEAYYLLYQNDQLFRILWSGYFIAGLHKSGNVTITCVPRNGAGDGENNSKRVEVKEPPEISNCSKIINNTYLAYGAVSETDNVKLMCKISGSKPLNASWRYGSKEWNQETLELPSINRKDAGTYEIRVKSGGVCNETAKRNISLEVYYPTDIIKCSNKTVLEGEDVQLVCIANGNPPPDVMWRRNGNIRGMGSTLLIKDVTRSDGGKYTFLANNSLGHETEDIFITVKYIDHLEVIGSSNKSYSQTNLLVLFNLSINAYPSNASLSCHPSAPNILTVITSHDAGINTKQYLVFVVIKNDEDSASIVCRADNGVGVREKTLYFYRRPILFKVTFAGQFRITNQEWQDELKDAQSTGYNDLKKNCLKILQDAYFGIPNLAFINIKKFVKGSIVVRFELEVIGQVPDPLLPLRDYIKERGGDINGLRIDYNSIQKSSDLKDGMPPQTTGLEENKTPLVAVLGSLLALAIILNILLIGGIIWLRRKDSKGNSGKRSNKSDERGQMNDISLQETSFTATDNATPNVPGYEQIGRRGLATSNDGMPEYEEVAARTQPPQQSGVQTNNPMPQYESADGHRQTGAVVNPPPATYQTIQPRTGNYGSLSPLTRLPPKDIVLSLYPRGRLTTLQVVT